MQARLARTIVLLATGGTIAGRGGDVGYRAGVVPVDDLVAGLDARPHRLEAIALDRIDSKDVDFGHWRRWIDEIARQLARPDVAGVVVTHGTDTLEETAYLVQRLLAPSKPVVLVGAMRPADSRQSDGPQNLADALTVAAAPGARGVVAVFGGRIWHGLELRKLHPYRLDAFGSGDAGPVGWIEAGRIRRVRDWPEDEPLGADTLPADPDRWPVVEIVSSQAGARAATVDAMVASGAEGLVIATTGNGTVHAALAPAIRRAIGRGVQLLRATRCTNGGIVDDEAPGGSSDPDAPDPDAPDPDSSDLPDTDSMPSAGRLTPVQARIELMLRIAASRGG